MKILTSLKSTFKLAAVAAAVLATTSLTNCGGGGGSGGGDATIRPKTLEGVTLSMSGNNASFQFLRSASSSTAQDNNDVETGSFLFNSQPVRAPYRSVENGFVDVIWPRTVGVTNYSFRALNDTSAELTLTVSSATQWDSITGPIGTFTADYSYFEGTATPSSLIMLISFDGSGSAGIRIDDPDSPLAGTGSSSTFTSGTFTVDGQPMPAGYDSSNSNSQSGRLALSSITGTNIEFTDVISANSFSLIPTATATSPSGEIGQTIYRDSSGTAIGNAADFSYSVTSGTDIATLVLSGGTPIDGTITLTYTSTSASSGGFQTQQAGGTYTNTSGGSGTFNVAQQ